MYKSKWKPYKDVPQHHQIIWQDAIDNIRFTKLQQWRVFSGTLAVYGALYGFSGEIGNSFAAAFVLLALGVGCWTINRMTVDMEKFRKRFGYFNDLYMKKYEINKLVLIDIIVIA